MDLIFGGKVWDIYNRREKGGDFIMGMRYFFIMGVYFFLIIFYSHNCFYPFDAVNYSERRIRRVSDWPEFIVLDRENKAITDRIYEERKFFGNYFGKELATWWLYHALRLKAGVKELKPDNLPSAITMEEISDWCGRVYFLETKEFISEVMKEGDPTVEDRIIHMLRDLGYEKIGNKFVLKHRPKDGIFPFQIDSTQILGKILAPQIFIPEPTDPAIYRPHMGRGQSGYYNLKEAQAEGLFDAITVIEYLKKYNELIANPTVKNFILATLNPNTSTGPYFLTMLYLMKSNIPDHFIKLLHAGIRIQILLREIKGGDMKFPDDYNPIDFWMFGQILKKYLAQYGEIH